MISPYVRRRRLAYEIIALREEHDLTSGELAAAIGVPRQSISRLENGHVAPDLEAIMRILKLLSIGNPRWDQIMTIARDAQARGWWEKSARSMGRRQALYANLEAGACTIHEYQMTFIPGLLQTPEFTEARVRADQAIAATDFDPTHAVQARAARQRMLERPGGPTYDVIIDEMAVRRHTVPADVVCGQVNHLVDLGHHRDNITIRILPLTADIRDHAVPRSAFSIYHYPDPADPVVVAVDTITSDLVLTAADEVGRYTALHERVQQAALTPADSADFLAAVAEDLTERI